MTAAETARRPAAGPRRPLPWIARPLLVAVGLVLGLALAEVGVRLVRRQAVLIVPDAIYAPEPGRGFGLAPGFRGTITNRAEFSHRVTINSAGLRGPEVPGPDGRLRVLVLGDSFAFGIGVEQEETLGARLAERLGAAGTPAVAFNGGVPGYGVPDAAARLEKLAAGLGPDLIVLAIFVGNDLWDAADPFSSVRHGFVYRSGQRSSARVLEWLYFHSDLFVLVKTFVPTRWYERVRRALGLAESARLGRLRRESELYCRAPGAALARGLEATGRGLDRIARIGRDLGAPVVAVVIPDLQQVDPQRWHGLYQELELDPSAFDPQAPTRRILELLEGAGIPALDLTPALAAASGRGEEVYYPIDHHWTAAGHGLAGGELAAFLARLGWPPANG